ALGAGRPAGRGARLAGGVAGRGPHDPALGHSQPVPLEPPHRLGRRMNSRLNWHGIRRRCITEHQSSMQHEWDMEADVIVVGFGAAGVAASVTAHDLGAEVVILEKAPEGEEGGNTRVAGQGYLNTSSIDKAAAYLTALCGPYTVPEAMVKVWAEEMCQNNAWLESLGGDPQEHQHQPVG